MHGKHSEICKKFVERRNYFLYRLKICRFHWIFYCFCYMFVPIKFAVKGYTKNINRFVAFDLIAGDSDVNFRLVVSMKQTQIRLATINNEARVFKPFNNHFQLHLQVVNKGRQNTIPQDNKIIISKVSYVG